MKTKKTKGIIAAVAALIIIAAGVVIFMMMRGRITATTMRILRIEGTVSMKEDGIVKAIRESLRLKSGNELDTDAESLVSIGLDESKIVTLDEYSCAEVAQEGRHLNLKLTEGSLFFEVDKPLEEDESFEICTSTMVVGIRGTSGWVSVEGETESLIISDGHVQVIGMNPVTGEVKMIEISAGQRLNIYLYNDRDVDSIMFEVIDISERELSEFVLERLRENLKLLDKVVDATDWDKPWILGESDDTVTVADVGGNGEGDPEAVAVTTPDRHDQTSAKTQEAPGEDDHYHVYTSVVTTPATCDSTGIRTYTCACGDTYTEVIPVSEGHQLVLTAGTEATCVTPGTATYTCLICGYTFTEEQPATGVHDFEGGNCLHNSVCTVCGIEGPLGEHHFVTLHHDEVTHTETLNIQFPGNQGQAGPVTVTVVDHPAYDEYCCEVCGVQP
ncbi:MAG: FecR domain-containing protein [Lachnospiraceae bacterium]|nr:FecR domain-containing protein [Lachnospiraceae bacterium]